MRIALVIFDGFNEIDTFVALTMLNRVDHGLWSGVLTAPTETVTSMNGVTVITEERLAFANAADVVLFGSGIASGAHARDLALRRALKLDSRRQLVGSQCSGALFLAALGLLTAGVACADAATGPELERLGLQVLPAPFHACGNVATAGGCLASPYLAAWVIARLAGLREAERVVATVAPTGERQAWVSDVLRVVSPTIEERRFRTL